MALYLFKPGQWNYVPRSDESRKQMPESAGRWLVNKARRQQRESGTYAAARNLRKQGCPLALALLLLVGRA